jgi:hypothetical protein
VISYGAYDVTHHTDITPKSVMQASRQLHVVLTSSYIAYLRARVQGW